MKIRFRDELRHRRVLTPITVGIAVFVIGGTAIALGISHTVEVSARADALVEQTCGFTQPHDQSGISSGKFFSSRTVVDNDGVRITIRDVIRTEDKVFLYEDDEGAPFCTVDLTASR